VTRQSPHRAINPDSLPEPWGFSHAVVAAPGRTVYVAGQTAAQPDGSMPDGIAEQVDAALRNVVEALRAAGAEPDDVVSMQVFTTDLAAYLGASRAVGERYRARFGRHYPAMALLEVKGLVGGAKVEIMCVATIPDPR
jgi:enamine deaminase RidA (YjgF/YER057c/UK114 family)